MSNINNKNMFLIILAGLFLATASSLIITTCKLPTEQVNTNNNNNELEDSPDGDTRLVVAMHDAPFKMEDHNVQELNITVEKIVIIDENDKHITLLQEERQMELLSISRSDPVVLSNVSVEPGTYKELRLVLKDNSTIKVDGEVYHIKIPSGSQSGLKLKGPFVIPRGKLFRLIIDFVASESVHWNKGQGWMLKPVLRISNDAEIIGIFRGKFEIDDDLGACETLFQMYSDNTARLRISDYPDYTLYANYVYNSSKKELRITNLSLSAPGLSRRELKGVMKKLPNEIVLPVKQWSIDSIIAIDTNGLKCNLYRVDEFNFSDGVSATEFTLNIDYPNGSKNGKNVITEIQFIDTGMPPLTYLSAFEGSRITLNVTALNSSIQGSSTRIQIISYLFDDPSNLNLESGFFASRLVPLMMTDSHFSESTQNPWQKPDIFKINKDMTGQEFTITFPRRLNIQMQHDNFTNNRPVITWDSHPNASHGYFVHVLVRNKNRTASDDGEDFFAIAYEAYAKEPKVTVFSNLITFTNTYTTIHEIPPSIVNGDFMIIEVFVLDGSSTLDMQFKKGAILMDTKIINR
ncbi:DUF4382 domain-containing protein [Treponema sp. R80B11-R83G3]